MFVTGILCSKATHNPDTGTDIIGAFTNFVSGGFPIAPRICGYYQIALDKNDDGKTLDFYFAIRPNDSPESAQLLDRKKLDVRLDGADFGVVELIMMTPENFRIPAPGLYGVELVCGKELVLSLLFEARLSC